MHCKRSVIGTIAMQLHVKVEQGCIFSHRTNVCKENTSERRFKEKKVWNVKIFFLRKNEKCMQTCAIAISFFITFWCEQTLTLLGTGAKRFIALNIIYVLSSHGRSPLYMSCHGRFCFTRICLLKKQCHGSLPHYISCHGSFVENVWGKKGYGSLPQNMSWRLPQYMSCDGRTSQYYILFCSLLYRNNYVKELAWKTSWLVCFSSFLLPGEFSHAGCVFYGLGAELQALGIVLPGTVCLRFPRAVWVWAVQLAVYKAACRQPALPAQPRPDGHVAGSQLGGRPPAAGSCLSTSRCQRQAWPDKGPSPHRALLSGLAGCEASRLARGIPSYPAHSNKRTCPTAMPHTTQLLSGLLQSVITEKK